MNEYRPSGFLGLSPVVKYLLIINVALYIITIIANKFGIDLGQILGMHSPKSEFFIPFQLVTHMFMHGSITHLFFNMFALWMFGKTLEEVWGSQRFFIYYFVCGFGAAILHLLVNNIEINLMINKMEPQLVNTVINDGSSIFAKGMNYTNALMGDLNALINRTTVGASGAIYGLLLAFGVLFPNSLIYLYFAIPIKTKYFVIGLILVELYLGYANNAGDNVAHFAHLGGMIFGLILLLIWKKNKFNRWN